MDRFLVPQYIDVENKIIGPVTARQFVEILIGAGLCFIVWKLVYAFIPRVVIMFIIAAITLIIAFSKVNGMPFHFFILNVIQTLKKPGLRVWQKGQIKDWIIFEEEKKKEKTVFKAPAKSRHLSDLSLVVDTGGAYSGDLEE